MTVNDFIKKLQQLQPKLKDKELVISSPNGLIVSPKLKMLLKDETRPFSGVDNVSSVIITHE